MKLSQPQCWFRSMPWIDWWTYTLVCRCISVLLRKCSLYIKVITEISVLKKSILMKEQTSKSPPNLSALILVQLTFTLALCFHDLGVWLHVLWATFVNVGGCSWTYYTFIEHFWCGFDFQRLHLLIRYHFSLIFRDLNLPMTRSLATGHSIFYVWLVVVG